MIRSINLFYLGIGLLLFSCAKELTDADRQKLPRQKAQDLINVMDSLSHRKPDFFYTKIATDYSDTNQNISILDNQRIKNYLVDIDQKIDLLINDFAEIKKKTK